MRSSPGCADPPDEAPAAAPLDAVAVLESMGDAFYALDAEWRFTYANRRALEFWQLAKAELIGKSVWDVLPAMRGTYNETALRQVAASREPLAFEAPSPTTGRIVSVTIGPAGGHGVAVYFRDVTERTRAEQRLRASEEHLRLAQEAGGIGTWERSVPGDEMTGSEMMFRLLGHEPEEGGNLLPLLAASIHPEDRESVLAATRAFSRRPGPLRVATRVVWPDGDVRWLVFIGRVVAKADGAPQRMLGICLDVTARRRIEEQLTASSERLRVAMKAGGLATWQYDALSGLREWSPEATATFGFPPERTVMSPEEWKQRVHPDDIFRQEEAFRAALASGDDYICEYRLVLPDSSIRWIAAMGSVRRDEHGRALGMVGVAQDITARRHDEDELRELNRALEVRVAAEVAAREAAQVRAAHAERMQALGQLAGGIAHDFNNVLQAVHGGASLIERRPDDPESVRRFARMILDASARGAAITGRLLAFGRRSNLRAEPLDPGELLHGLREILAHALGVSLSVLVDAPADLPAVMADRGQLETALVNLATNARDAMPEGGVLGLSAAREQVPHAGRHRAGLHPGRYVRIVVTDTGTGMDAATLARASEPFFTTKPIGKGTGLGLAMARGFAEQSGGGFAIESRPAEGTTVTLWLPVAEGARIPEARGGGDEVPSVAASATRILVVDDDPIARQVLAAELEDAGYDVIEASDGEVAGRMIEGGLQLDAMVTDLSMPGGDGLALIRRAQALRPRLPAILLASYTGEGAAMAVGGAVSGQVELLRKPVSRNQLADRLAALLEPRG